MALVKPKKKKKKKKKKEKKKKEEEEGRRRKKKKKQKEEEEEEEGRRRRRRRKYIEEEEEEEEAFGRVELMVLNYEEDVAVYTVKASTDPRVANRVIIYRPTRNITSQLDLISLWEKKTGRTLKRSYVPEDEIIKLSE
ncbi:hypothetical protein TIFTF001_044695, partial [Ficus carica]